MTKIKVRNGETLEELKARERFQKPSEIKRLQKKEKARKISFDNRRK